MNIIKISVCVFILFSGIACDMHKKDKDGDIMMGNAQHSTIRPTPTQFILGMLGVMRPRMISAVDNSRKVLESDTHNTEDEHHEL